jgi:hypothetical protein
MTHGSTCRASSTTRRNRYKPRKHDTPSRNRGNRPRRMTLLSDEADVDCRM